MDSLIIELSASDSSSLKVTEASTFSLYRLFGSVESGYSVRVETDGILSGNIFEMICMKLRNIPFERQQKELPRSWICSHQFSLFLAVAVRIRDRIG